MISRGTENKTQIPDHDLHHQVPSPVLHCHILLCMILPPTIHTAVALAFFLASNIRSIPAQGVALAASVSCQLKFQLMSPSQQTFLFNRVLYFGFFIVLFIMNLIYICFAHLFSVLPLQKSVFSYSPLYLLVIKKKKFS